jgi:hypothetical protein
LLCLDFEFDGFERSGPFSSVGESRVLSMSKKSLPMTLFLTAAFISFLFSVFLWFFVDKDSGVFVGIWVPSILSLAAATRRP